MKKYNDLKIILMSTEDMDLKEMLTTVISLIDIMPTYNGKKYGFTRYREPKLFNNYEITTINEWYSAYQTYKTELKRYVDYRIAQEKPAWMVMAEKHGWTPPK